jgi:hypothetical protein
MAVLRTLEDTRAAMTGTMWSERGMSRERLHAVATASADEIALYMGTLRACTCTGRRSPRRCSSPI